MVVRSQHFLPRPWGTYMVQGWLLAVYFFLCLQIRADALTCRNCVSVWPLAPCIPFKATCQAHGGACFTLKIYGEKRLEKIVLSCIEKEMKKCGMTWKDPKTHLKYKFNCCSDRDKCNWKPWTRPWKHFNNQEESEKENLNSSDPFVAGSRRLIQNLVDNNTNCSPKRE